MVGGDNAARAVAIGMVLGAYHGVNAIPQDGWTGQKLWYFENGNFHIRLTTFGCQERTFLFWYTPPKTNMEHMEPFLKNMVVCRCFPPFPKQGVLSGSIFWFFWGVVPQGVGNGWWRRWHLASASGAKEYIECVAKGEEVLAKKTRRKTLWNPGCSNTVSGVILYSVILGL